MAGPQFRQRSRSRNRSRSRTRARSRFASKLAETRNKQVLIVKTENILGITVSDNASGRVYIRRIRPDTICGQLQDQIQVGDLIEKVNGESMIGKRHFQVARLLRSIALGRIITLELVPTDESVTSPIVTVPIVTFPAEPEIKITEISVAEKAEVSKPTIVEEPKKKEVIVQEESPNKKLIECINGVFETYLGFDDDDLALSIWKLASGCSNLLEMSKRIRESSELSQFDFPEELIFDMWGIVDDYKHKRMATTESGQIQRRGKTDN